MITVRLHLPAVDFAPSIEDQHADAFVSFRASGTPDEQCPPMHELMSDLEADPEFHAWLERIDAERDAEAQLRDAARVNGNGVGGDTVSSEPAHVTSATPITCKVGLCNDPAGDTGIWIESPRTGARLVIRNGWRHELPDRLSARIVKLRSEGGSTLALTPAQLHAVKALADKIDAHLGNRLPAGSNYGRELSRFASSR